jgi:hypothetical protein
MSEKNPPAKNPPNPQMKLALSAEAAIRTTQLKQLEEDSNALFNQLVVGVKQDRTKLPESVFVNNFLPYFAQQRPISEHPNLITEWVGIAGNPMAEVDIVNDQTGEVVGTVPPIYDSSIVENSKRALGQSFSEILHECQLRGNQLPIMAKSFFARKVIDQHEKLLKPSEHQTENQANWNKLMARYGLNQQPEQAATPTPEKTAAESLGDDSDLVFD